MHKAARFDDDGAAASRGERMRHDENRRQGLPLGAARRRNVVSAGRGPVFEV
jgi:hypothetical protein